MDAALRIFLIVSGNISGTGVKFFWPPVNHETPTQSRNSEKHKENTGAKAPHAPLLETKTSAPIAKNLSPNDIPRRPISINGLKPSKSHPIKPQRSAEVVKKNWTLFTIEQDFHIYGIPLATLGDVLYPNHRYHHKIFELKIDNILYISFPFCWKKKERRSEKLHGFNIVFAINLSMHFNKLTEQNKKMWFDLIIKYVRIIQHEERRIAYLSSQLTTMRNITKSVLNEVNKRKKEEKECKMNSKNIGNKCKKEVADVVTTVLTEICKKCPIANDMKRIQEILSVSDEIKLLVNGWVELHCSLKPPEQDIIIRPYHTLLLLPQQNKQTNASNDEEEKKHDTSMKKDDVNNLRCIRKDAYDLLQQMPISGSQSLRLMISTANICSSFGDMASVTNIPLPTLFHFALHLKYWGKAQIIETINKSSQFVINPNANFQLISSKSVYQQQFAEAFPHRKTLIEELVRFNHPQPLSKMLVKDHQEIESFKSPRTPSKDSYYHKQDFIFLIAWLLQRKLIIRLHRYIKYVNQNGINHKAVGANTSRLHSIFEKMKVYLNGENHFLEVMFQTGLSSKKLQQVVDEFDDQLISYYHPQDH
eukprot:32186_1